MSGNQILSELITTIKSQEVEGKLPVFNEERRKFITEFYAFCENSKGSLISVAAAKAWSKRYQEEFANKKTNTIEIIDNIIQGLNKNPIKRTVFSKFSEEFREFLEKLSKDRAATTEEANTWNNRCQKEFINKSVKKGMAKKLVGSITPSISIPLIGNGEGGGLSLSVKLPSLGSMSDAAGKQYQKGKDAAKKWKNGDPNSLANLIKAGKLEDIKALLNGDGPVDLNEPCDEVNNFRTKQRLPLEIAFNALLKSETPNYAIIYGLLDLGANPNITFSDKKSTPLSRAIIAGNSALVTKLIEKGANVNEVINGKSMLELAWKLENKEIRNLLLANGANPNIIFSGRKGKTPLALVLEMPQATSSSELECPRQSLLNTFLFIAISREDKGFVETLLKNGANIEAKKDGNSALELAWDKTEVRDLLIKKGADVNKAFSDNTTPLSRAINVNDQVLTSKLIEKGADKDAVVSGKSMLEMAWDKLAIRALLIAEGAKMNVVFSGKATIFTKGDTPKATLETWLDKYLAKQDKFADVETRRAVFTVLSKKQVSSEKVVKFVEHEGGIEAFALEAKSAHFWQQKGAKQEIRKHAGISVGITVVECLALFYLSAPAIAYLAPVVSVIGYLAYAYTHHETIKGYETPAHIAANAKNQDLLGKLVEKYSSFKDMVDSRGYTPAKCVAV